MSVKRLVRVMSILVVFSMLLTPLAALAQGPMLGDVDNVSQSVRASNRLIIELEAPSLATWAASSYTTATFRQSAGLFDSNGRLNVGSTVAQDYIAQLKTDQTIFVNKMQSAFPDAQVSTFINEYGMPETNSYQIVMNGMAIDPGSMSRDEARRILAKMDGVKNVYLDFAHTPSLYTSTQLINAPAVWDMVGGQENGGAGVKMASMDGGIHKDAPMFDGTDFSYPSDFPPNGLGLTANNNGKIIASRVYFRAWDPPAPGDENPWPGTNGTPHGVHTSGIAAGNIITDVTYSGYDVGKMSGVAPAAWVMSYRVFYNSVTGDGSFYNAEGIAALEDIVADGADVLNNSWGGGPGSIGGEFDALDVALINATEAGIFVSMSAGNAGPGNGTTDHPSDDYINVAASTTSGTLASGKLNVIAPTPITDTLQDMPFGTADFGDPLPIGAVVTYTFKTAASVDPANVTGCNAFAGTPFTGTAAIISRGGCFFSDKVYNAEQAGAEFVVIYNNAGDGLINMASGSHAGEITIPSVFVGQTNGDGMVAWYTAHGNASVLELDTLAFQAGNRPDVIASFSSRGPGVGNVLKPDITAPGVNILSQGYTPGATGEARHMGYGQASGTSMAAPHVTGAAALVRQVHPDWSNAYIKSALMSTSKFMGVYNGDGSQAQPLDMGAGRLDLANATDPGIILDPPSLSFGLVPTGTTKSLDVMVTNIATATETYILDAVQLQAESAFGTVGTLAAPWLTVSPISITLTPGETTKVTVTFDPSTGEYGDNQGFLLLTGNTHVGHMPGWARVTYATPIADVLIIDNDFNYLLSGYPNYLGYYTNTLESLGYSYAVWNADAHFNNATTIPDATTLAAYRAVIYYTGDNYNPDGTFTVSTPLTELDMDRLTEYANMGGVLIAMGQDMAAVLGSDASDDGTFFYNAILGGNWLQDTISGFALPALPVIATNNAPVAFNNVSLNLTDAGDSAANQFFVDELMAKPFKDPDDPDTLMPYVPLFKYPGGTNVQDGIVGMAHRDQPTLERPGISYDGRSIYTTFGLEGVNNGITGATERADLLETMLAWGWDNSTTAVTSSNQVLNNSLLTTFTATVTSMVYGGEGTGVLPISGNSGVSYRWDFGDDSGISGPYSANVASHQYNTCGTYNVKVESVDVYGTHSIGEEVVNVTQNCAQHLIYLPLVFK